LTCERNSESSRPVTLSIPPRAPLVDPIEPDEGDWLLLVLLLDGFELLLELRPDGVDVELLPLLDDAPSSLDELLPLPDDRRAFVKM
jgi:hypothetical protein